MKQDNVTAGKTAKVEKTAPIKAVIQTLKKLLVTVGESFKKVGGTFITEKEFERYLNTLATLSSVGPYETTVSVSGGIYPLESYQIDSRVAEAFVMPRAVKMPAPSPFCRDLSPHYKVSDIMTPAELTEFQYKLMAQFKVQPQTISAVEAIKPMNIGEVSDVSNGDKCHVEDLVTVKSMPIMLDDCSVFWSEEYFNYDISQIARQVVVNFYTSVIKG